ncbi:MAG: FAD-dependent 5-carboxymethylaminomethyl-2-thiouridine(34) oxidoreductase MnmC, partial [Xanthomonadales bacterium]|nr:FAD-dependent 5-carboxymethylaminomethyl-2-thiouridine(34) oxidoreductase MnmC [Xanthomonadales bacterium]
FNITSDITLTLLLGDVVECFKQLYGKVDAWFLDGFAPSRNPEMWRAELFQQMARLSTKGTTFATFSAAAMVKKGLSAAGFTVQKRSGFGQKREMLVGCFQNPVFSTQTPKQPWHPLPSKTNNDNTITIVGGGIAGLCLAKSFHQASYQTTVIDQHAKPLQQASGNGYAMIMPLITAQKTPEALFYLRAFEYAKQVYQSAGFQPIGVTELIQSEAAQLRAKAIEQLSLPEQLLTEQTGAIHYPEAGYIDTHVLVKNWLAYISHWLQGEVSTINHNNDLWQLFNHQGQLIHECKTLIIASGMASQTLIHSQQLQLTAKLGQTHQLKTAASLELDNVLLNQGYIIPVDNNAGHYLIGATFDHVNQQDWLHPDFSDIDHLTRNLQHWAHSDLYESLSHAKLHSSHTALRATTTDHLPICGPVIDEKQFIHDYKDLHHGRHWRQYPKAATIENLYVLTGLGSRGFTSAPLLADYLKSMITGEPLPLEADLCKIIHPNRFNYRQLKRAKKP